jgi:hypothetical protein
VQLNWPAVNGIPPDLEVPSKEGTSQLYGFMGDPGGTDNPEIDLLGNFLWEDARQDAFNTIMQSTVEFGEA